MKDIQGIIAIILVVIYIIKLFVKKGLTAEDKKYENIPEVASANEPWYSERIPDLPPIPQVSQPRSPIKNTPIKNTNTRISTPVMMERSNQSLKRNTNQKSLNISVADLTRDKSELQKAIVYSEILKRKF